MILILYFYSIYYNYNRELNFKNNSFIDFSEFPLFEDLTIL